MFSRLTLPTLALSIVSCTALAAEPPAARLTEEQFENRVRPILVNRCLECHGPKKQESGLRVDSREALVEGGTSGPAIVPGDADGSLLVQAIRYDSDPKMPPKTKLPADESAVLAAWVKAGAPWPAGAKVSSEPDLATVRRSHWSLQPIARPALPDTHDRAWPAAPIDRFVLARLEEEKLTPSPAADRRTLIRRATFALIGLPPTPDDVAQFVADPSPDAFAHVVDRLLSSPRYGERWGRHWLDVARYADTKGYVFFEESSFPWAYTYRDYVIEAFNADLPYDRFVREQLAADLLPLGENRRPLRALGFLTLGGRFMNNRHDIIDDRIDVVSRGLLGLTVTCARCHDHKYDPIPTADYYSLYGVMASCTEPNVPPLYEPPPDTDAYRTFAQELAAKEKKLAEFVAAKHKELVGIARERAGDYLLAAHAASDIPNTDQFMLLADGGDLNPKMIERFQVYLKRTRRRHDAVFAPWHALASIKPEEFAAQAPGVLAALFADKSRPINARVAQALAEKPPASLADAAGVYGAVLARVDAAWRSSQSGGVDPPSSLADPIDEELRQVLYGPDSPPLVPFAPAGDLELLPDRAAQGQLKELLGAVEKHRAAGAAAPPRAMVLEDLPQPHEPRVFVRGNPNNLGPAVSRRMVSLVSAADAPAFTRGSGRRELAEAIVDPRNPLAARVLVNRVWMHHFGQPLVGTPSDFGLRSERPTHPALLDFLARELIDSGWSIKSLHRRIMLSAVYQQQSDERPACRAIDPENALLWKMNRRRLDYESLRDAIASAGGMLDAAIGGPSVDLAATPRRAMYGLVDRLNVPGVLRTFDFPSPDATSPRRDQTTVPPQALFLMNHPLPMQAAAGVLRRAEIAAEQDPARRVAAIYRLLYAREPADDESRLALAFVSASQEASAWQLYVHTLLMANEFCWID